MTKQVRLLVCGGRNFGYVAKDENPLDPEVQKRIKLQRACFYKVMDTFYKENPNLLVIQGGAKGADKLAKQWANIHEVASIEYMPDWSNYGKAAGILRNIDMLEDGEPDVTIAFPGSTGTKHMVSISRKANVKVIEIDDPYS